MNDRASTFLARDAAIAQPLRWMLSPMYCALEDVGYESEAAFNRAFKREAWRRERDATAA
jgi:AraC-like DNA-binding protein